MVKYQDTVTVEIDGQETEATVIDVNHDGSKLSGVTLDLKD